MGSKIAQSKSNTMFQQQLLLALQMPISQPNCSTGLDPSGPVYRSMSWIKQLAELRSSSYASESHQPHTF